MKTEVNHKIPDGLTVTIPEKVLFQQLGNAGDEVVLLDMDSGGYYGLNEVGSRIWSLLQERRPIPEIVSILVEEYEVSEECLKADVKQFLDDLHARGLIEIMEISEPDAV